MNVSFYNQPNTVTIAMTMCMCICCCGMSAAMAAGSLEGLAR